MVSGFPSSVRGGLDKAAPNHHTYGELLDMAFPYYLSIGMTSDEYWNGSNDLKPAFRKAHKMRIRDLNHGYWLQGRYIYDALWQVSPLFRAFSKAKEPVPYPDRPYAIDAEEVKQREEEKKRQEYEKSLAGMKSRMEKWNKVFWQKHNK